MRSAFTLIELLVVITIIAILAAILFPVFASAKTAAKKSVAINCQKQISAGLLLYMGDNDDQYPRQDSCSPKSSLNPELNSKPFSVPGPGCTFNGYYYRNNHFSWQKYILPYVKAVAIFEHPLREKDPENWKTNGQIFGSFALNLGFVGAIDTNAGTSPNKGFGHRVSFTGGTNATIPDPARAGILMEATVGDIGVIATMTDDTKPNTSELIAYPLAVREYWRYKVMKGTAEDCVNGTSGTEPDPRKVAANGIVIGFADGSARFLSAAAFLAQTPTKSEIFAGGNYSYGNDCSNFAGNFGFTSLNTNIEYPLWGFHRS